MSVTTDTVPKAGHYPGPVVRSGVSFEDYLELDQQLPGYRYEFFGGEVFEMAGGSYQHSNVTDVLLALLLVPIRRSGGCSAGTDIRVWCPDVPLGTFPEISATLLRPEWNSEQPSGTLVNPQLIIEVLSPSTRNYDLGDKFVHYQSIDSLEEYVCFEQDEAKAYVHHREDGWRCETILGLEAAIELKSVRQTVRLSDVYEFAEFVE